MSRDKESTRISVSIKNELLDSCDKTWKTHGFSSRNNFVNKAIEHYIATLTIENGGSAVTDLLAESFDKYSTSMGRKLSKSLYRYAVEIQMMMQMLAYTLELTDDEVKKIKEHSIYEVKKLQGRLNLDSVVDYQKEMTKKYGRERRIVD